MNSLWNDQQALEYGSSPLQLRVYTSRLLGQHPSLVLHGGGNTSVKDYSTNVFGESEEVLYVKGSGWDLATIEEAGFAPVKLEALQKMATLPALSDRQMVNEQRAAMTNPNAPNPSIEAILHAIIPFKYVDHSHADAVVTISNTPDGARKIEELYGDQVIVIPYVMAGFVLAQQVYQMTQELDWKSYKGMILLHHGVFSFADTAKESYERMIDLVDQAEKYLQTHQAWNAIAQKSLTEITKEDLLQLATTRKEVSLRRGSPVIAQWDQTEEAVGFASMTNVEDLSTRGPLTPDHVIRNKQMPLILEGMPVYEVAAYHDMYLAYFEQYREDSLQSLDTAPRWCVWKEKGTIAFGKTTKEVQIITDIIRHTRRAFQWGEALGGWKALPAKDIFEIEYWELEQAKLKKNSSPSAFEGKVVLVSGAASGIGKACTEMFLAQGACVVALDIHAQIETLFATTANALGITCDMTDTTAVEKAIFKGIETFGGLDIVVSNAGIFPASQRIEAMEADAWEKSLELNLTAHQRLLQATTPFLEQGLQPAVIFIGSKNVHAPGAGAAAYSVAKAGLAQLARVAAMELGKAGIRVNTVHPNAVFDTALWTEEVLQERAESYGLTVEEYKTNNILRTEVTSVDVARMVCTMAGEVFAKTTGAQVALDGGNDRVI